MNKAYTISADDVLAMNKYFTQKFPPMRKRMNMYRILYASILGISLIVFAYIFRDNREVPLFFFALALVCSIAAYILFPVYQSVMIPINTKIAIKRGRYQGFIGNQTLTATNEYLTIQSKMGEGKYYWQAFIHKGQSPQHLFLFPNTASAVVIPKRIFLTTDELQEFLKFTEEIATN